MISKTRQVLSERHKIMSSLRRQGLTFQLFVFIVLPLAVLLIVIPLGSLTLHEQAMRLLVGERDERAARAASSAIAEQLNHRAAAIRGLALHSADADSPGQSLADYAFLLADFEGGLAVFANDGSLLASSPSSETWRSRPTTELLAKTAGQLTAQFSIAFADPAGNEALVMVAAASANGPIAVGAFSPASLARRSLTDTFSSAGQSFVLMVDDQGQVLYNAGAVPSSEAEISQHPGVAEALRGQTGATYLSLGDSEHVVAFSPVPPVGWALVIEEPWEQVDNPLLRRTQAAPLILIPVLLFALVAVGFGIRQIIQPLRALEQQASELAWGRFDAIEKPVGGIVEIRRLQAQLILMAQKVKAGQQNLRGYLNAITAGQEDERRRLARELHDGTVQALVALDQQVQLTQLVAKDALPKTAERLAELRQLTASLIEEVRRVIRALRPNYLEDLGLLPAIEMLTRDLQTTAEVQTAFSTGGQPRRLPPGQEIAIYRIVQEALNNAARYASARAVNVSAVFNPTEFILQVQDDGKGFTAPERVSDLVASGHYGLMGMQERAELIGARLTIQSAPDAGTTIELRLPL
jgi:signal transduction histidine kinase